MLRIMLDAKRVFIMLESTIMLTLATLYNAVADPGGGAIASAPLP